MGGVSLEQRSLNCICRQRSGRAAVLLNIKMGCRPDERYMSMHVQAVFRQGAACLPAGAAESPAAVPGILARWIRELQATRQAHDSAERAAEAAMRAEGGASDQADAALLCERIVSHIQLLFDVPELDAVLPAINQASDGCSSPWHASCCLRQSSCGAAPCSVPFAARAVAMQCRGR